MVDILAWFILLYMQLLSDDVLVVLAIAWSFRSLRLRGPVKQWLIIVQYVA